MASFDLKLLLTRIGDEYVKEAFKKLIDYIRADVFRRGDFRYLEVTAPLAGAGSFPHPLGYQPQDVITLSVAPSAASVRWKYELFTPTTLAYTVTAPCTVRIFVGKYREDK